MGEQLQFEGQAVIVTGAGQGLGREYALLLAARGAAVVVNDLAGAAADDVVARIAAAGGRAVASYDSVATEAGGEAIVAEALERFGRLDAVVNNAGFLRNGYFEDLTERDIRDVLDVHLTAAFYVTQPAWRAMKRAGYGRVVLTSSSSGAFSHQGLANYAAAKAGVLGLGRALAYEGAPYGIKVNCVLPFATTGIQANPIPDMIANAAPYRPEGSEEILKTRRDPGLVAPLVVFLASRQCEVTGEAFSSCLGRYARVFSGIAQGWLAADGVPAPEDVADHLDDIRELDGYEVPRNLFEETESVLHRLLAPSAAASTTETT